MGVILYVSSQVTRDRLYERHPQSKERLRIQSAHLFCCDRSLVSGVQCDVENCLMQLYVEPCHVVGAERGRESCGYSYAD